MKFIYKCRHHHLILTFILIMLQEVSTVEILCEDDQCDTMHQFDINTQISGNIIDMTWTFNESVLIYGFKPIIYGTDREILYESPLLHPTQRSMKISHELDKQNYVCVNVYLNSTHVLVEQCKSIETSDYKAIIGILAGTIFLVPCMIGLSYILYKDHQRNKDIAYTKIDIEAETKHPHHVIEPSDNVRKGGKKTEKSAELVLRVNVTDCTGVENTGYVTEDARHNFTTTTKTTPTTTPLTKTVPTAAAAATTTMQGDKSESVKQDSKTSTDIGTDKNNQNDDNDTVNIDIQTDDENNETVIIASEHM